MFGLCLRPADRRLPKARPPGQSAELRPQPDRKAILRAELAVAEKRAEDLRRQLSEQAE